MKIKNLTKMGALLVAIASFAVAPAQALTSREAKELKATILSVPVPEMPAKGAETRDPGFKGKPGGRCRNRW